MSRFWDMGFTFSKDARALIKKLTPAAGCPMSRLWDMGFTHYTNSNSKSHPGRRINVEDILHVP